MKLESKTWMKDINFSVTQNDKMVRGCHTLKHHHYQFKFDSFFFVSLNSNQKWYASQIMSFNSSKINNENQLTTNEVEVLVRTIPPFEGETVMMMMLISLLRVSFWRRWAFSKRHIKSTPTLKIIFGFTLFCLIKFVNFTSSACCDWRISVVGRTQVVSELASGHK